MPSCVGVDSSPRLGGRGPRPSSLPHILSDHRRPPVAGSVAPGSGGRWRGGRFVLGGPCTGRFSHTKWATQIRPLTGPQGTLVGRPTAAAPRGAPPVRAWLPPRLGLGGVPVPGLAVPSVGRGSPSPVRPAMAGCLGDIWTCREAVQHRTRGDIYTSSPVRRGPAVDGGDGASIDLSIHTYIHTYIYIYIYTQVLVDAPGHEIYCSETAVHPPAAGPRATRPDVPLSRRGAPLGVDAGPGGPFWPTANWSIPRLAPLHGDRPRERSARPWPTANWRERVSPATVARARARPQSSQSPSANWPTPRTPSIPSIRAPLAVGPGSRPPWPTAPAPTPPPARSGLLYGGPGPPGACADAVAACNGPRPAASPSSYGPRRVAP